MQKVTDEELISITKNIMDMMQNDDFLDDLEKTLKGNKSAAVRARLKTIEIAKLFKEFRQKTVQSKLVQ